MHVRSRGGDAQQAGPAADHDSAALLAMTLGIEETQLNFDIGALRSVLDLTSHLALVQRRTETVRQMHDQPGASRPSVACYRGHAKQWLHYACQCALAAVRQRRASWRAAQISHVVARGFFLFGLSGVFLQSALAHHVVGTCLR